jgi:hypothetical protein
MVFENTTLPSTSGTAPAKYFGFRLGFKFVLVCSQALSCAKVNMGMNIINAITNLFIVVDICLIIGAKLRIFSIKHISFSEKKLTFA